MSSLVGTTIGGYLVERLLGEGGMGAVYEARHPALGKRLAIKVLLPEYANHQVVTARFVQEAIVAAHIEHPNIVEVRDTATLPDGRHYIALEFLEGCDLEHYVEDRGNRLGEYDALLILLQVCCGLHDAHLAGVVHRDLKPPNVFITHDRRQPTLVKILDFGIAKIRTSRRATALQTNAKSVMGTPEYMAPEQATAPTSVDQRADVYALGGIIYRILSGRTPFQAETIEALILAKREQRPSPLSAQFPDLHRHWDTVIARCLAWEPGHRYPTVRALVEDLVDSIPAAAAILHEVWPGFSAQAGPHDATTRAPGSQSRSFGSTPTSLSGAVGVRTGTNAGSGAGGVRRAWLVLGGLGAAGVAVAIAVAVTRGAPGSAAGAPTQARTVDAGASPPDASAALLPAITAPPDANSPPDAASPPELDAGPGARPPPPPHLPRPATPTTRPRPPATHLPRPARPKPFDPEGVI
ncbi:MAG: protein kinase [Deltaproteobacteria bacterium]|nr:protein kinase [Deltaproteobacteria bacterium]